ncbi:cation:proton antiporter, partial [Thermococci archaeon]
VYTGLVSALFAIALFRRWKK